MRRKDREITDLSRIMDIMKKCDVCSVAFFDEEYPYVVPLNFGVSLEKNEIALYFHGANAGKKLDLIKKNNKVAFEMNTGHRLIVGEVACDTTMTYESVCGNGEISILGEDEKLVALTKLMQQYVQKEEFEFSSKMVEAIVVLKLKVNHISGKILKR